MAQVLQTVGNSLTISRPPTAGGTGQSCWPGSGSRKKITAPSPSKSPSSQTASVRPKLLASVRKSSKATSSSLSQHKGSYSIPESIPSDALHGRKEEQVTEFRCRCRLTERQSIPKPSSTPAVGSGTLAKTAEVFPKLLLRIRKSENPMSPIVSRLPSVYCPDVPKFAESTRKSANSTAPLLSRSPFKRPDKASVPSMVAGVAQFAS